METCEYTVSASYAYLLFMSGSIGGSNRTQITCVILLFRVNMTPQI
jgi:hypothetical protein